jgi:hypothetical protein
MQNMWVRIRDLLAGFPRFDTRIDDVKAAPHIDFQAFPCLLVVEQLISPSTQGSSLQPLWTKMFGALAMMARGPVSLLTVYFRAIGPGTWTVVSSRPYGGNGNRAM